MIDPERGGNIPEQPPDADQILPAADVFLDSEPPVATSAPPLEAISRPPGPGIWEAIAWMAGVHLVQLLASIFTALLIVVAALTAIDIGSIEKSLADPAALMALLSTNMIYIFGATQVATLAYAWGAIRLRCGRAGVARLGWQAPWRGHWLLVTLMVVPLQLLCGRLHELLARVMPGPADTFARTMEDLARAPLPILLLLIACGPAFAEELLFRGLIGGGLVARWGLVRGVVVTSLLFGIVHLYPGQAIAVVPVGIAMHFVYLTTRSFWAPITLHLLFNAVAAVVLKFQFDATISSIPTHVLTASAAMVTAIGLLLWQTRVQYILPDGSIWNPGYVSAEAPPFEAGAVPVRQNPRLLLLAGSAFNSLGFAAVLWRLAAA